MKISGILIPVCLIIISCRTDSDKLETGLNRNYLRGQFLIGDSVLDEFDLWACFCNLTESGIRITNTNSGLGGQSLTTMLSSRDTVVTFDTWDCVGRPPEYVLQSYSVTLVGNHFNIQDSLFGTIRAQGIFQEGDAAKAFRVRGQFRCVLKDSSYSFEEYHLDLLKIVNENRLKQLKLASVSNPDSVKEVELGYTELKEIPSEVRRFKNLTKLTLAGNDIALLDVSLLSDLDSLRELDISGNPIKEIPDNISELRNLQVLNFAGCELSSIPNGLFRVSKLKVLDLSFTELTAVPKEIKNLKQLEILNISNTKVWIVPTDIFDLPVLSSLALPDSIKPFKIHGSNLMSLKKVEAPYELVEFNKSTLQKLSCLEELSLSFRYKDYEEEKKIHHERIKLLKTTLSAVDIVESIFIEN